MFTTNFKRTAVTKAGSWLTEIDGKPAPERMTKLRIPPAWSKVQVDPDPKAVILAIGFDAAGRKQRLYSPEWVASAKSGKFERVRALLAEHDDIGTQIDSDINDRRTPPGIREAALMAKLIFTTGIRPGSTTSAKGDNSQEGTATFGATTLQLRHVKPALKCVVLAFIGKKGVKQRVKVFDPYLVRELRKRKVEGNKIRPWSDPLFSVGIEALRAYFRGLGSGQYTPKDFRTACGTKLALELLGSRKRLPKAKSKRRAIVNIALDKVASKLGNTRAVSRSAYVDPTILERFLPAAT